MTAGSTDPRTGDDNDLRSPEELSSGRFRRRLLVGLLLLVALLIGLYFAARPAARAVKAWQSRRLANETFALIEAAEWHEATAKARDSYTVFAAEPESWRAIARVLSRTHQEIAAVEWWAKLAAVKDLTAADRRDYAQALLASGDLTSANAQVDQLLARPGGPTPADTLVAAHVASTSSRVPRALELAETTMAAPRATPQEVFEAAVLIVSLSGDDTALYRKTWDRIVALAEDPSSPASLDALVMLARRPPLPGRATIARTKLAALLESHPKARPFHQLLALELRALEEPERAAELVEQAINRFGEGDNETLASLGAWLYARGQTAKLLELIPLERALLDPALFLQHIDALAAMGRLAEVKELLNSGRFPLEPVIQHMYSATTRARLGEPVGAKHEWERAFEAADNPKKLLLLARYAEKHREADIADQAYSLVITAVPKSREAYQGRLRLAQANDQTARLQNIAAEMIRQWPDEHGMRNDEAYLRLLLGASGEEAEEAERNAAALVMREPANWPARATLALARLRLGKNAEAFTAFPDAGDPLWSTAPPGALAVHTAALAATAQVDDARKQAHRLEGARLLPEERALLPESSATPSG